jgi:hypothetical protein
MMVLRLIQHFSAIVALLFGFIVGPETHVHPAENPHSEALVHAHAGLEGHTHCSRPGMSQPGEGPAVYLNAFSATSAHAVQIPIPTNFSSSLILSAPIITCDRVPVPDFSDAHAPPGVEFGHLRAPPRSPARIA